MIKALSLAAALALLPLSAAVAADVRGPSEDALEAAADAFEARMEAFGERAEAISEDKSLTKDQRELRIAALWTEYQPDVTAFTAAATQHASSIAAEALAEIDVNAVVAEALAGVDIGAVVSEAMAEVPGALAAAQGIATNGAWASNDPEHMATYGLVAEYTVGEAMDSLDEAGVAVAVSGEAVEAPATADED
ncbi:MAG: hypothetical protein PSV23_14895 [Brevundimonas sp.]|uniref:hypothetical protein n=1 Tax=Brevundimonas sp. TaxID=1871086 RepID=UPI00248A3FCA|nr:hypothetical protein [Brevundimonas sp.]MDI1328077.1 hypothetical protein [Brevundimonas sp.]